MVQEVCNTCGNHNTSEPTWMMFPGTDLFARIQVSCSSYYIGNMFLATLFSNHLKNTKRKSENFPRCSPTLVIFSHCNCNCCNNEKNVILRKCGFCLMRCCGFKMLMPLKRTILCVELYLNC